MFERITPEQAGVDSKNVEKYITALLKNNCNMHSVLMMKGDKLFAEYYWAPYDKDTAHRMYSQTKSYVGIAVGLLEEEGKLSLDDTLVSHFPEKIKGEVHPYIAAQTIRDTLMMCTCGVGNINFLDDPVELYLNYKTPKFPSGTHWRYDSTGTQVLTALVEKLAGKPMLEYLDEKIFCHLGTFKNAEMLKIANGVSFGSSALVCTPRDMISFGRFIMNYGVWGGKRLMNEHYLRDATSNLAPHELVNVDGGYNTYGYGYQIWTTQTGGFFFNGMGGQYMFADPKTDILFVCTADSQGDVRARDFVVSRFYELIIDEASLTPLPENKSAYASLEAATNDLKLITARGDGCSHLQEKINGKLYVCNENPQGIVKFSLHFDGNDNGEFKYTNAQGDKVLPFGIKKNVFGKFPQLGYSDEYFRVPTTNCHKYDCAASGAWLSENVFGLRVQIIDKYAGNFSCEFAFKGDVVTVTMFKNAEAFLDEYNGLFVATLAD